MDPLLERQLKFDRLIELALEDVDFSHRQRIGVLHDRIAYAMHVAVSNQLRNAITAVLARKQDIIKIKHDGHIYYRKFDFVGKPHPGKRGYKKQ
jgi:hypothetical protein